MNALSPDAPRVADHSVSYRPVRVGTAPARVERDGDGWRMESTEVLLPYPDRLTDRLIEGAQRHPERLLVAQRNEAGEWVGLTYAQMLTSAQSIASALIARRLSSQRPVAILSGNDLEHLQVAFGAMWAGIPYAPVSPAYSLVSKDFGKLRHVFELLTPGLVFVSDGASFGAALDAAVPDTTEVVVARNMPVRGVATPLASLLAATPLGEAAARDRAGPGTVAKILFTSGSTSLPKAVPTTHRMLCSNQQMLLQTFPEFAHEPPVLVDWLPWNHTFGGSHNVGIALYNGGTLYIDDGRPMRGKFDATVRNLRDVAPTVYFNVPKGWEELTVALEADAALRERFFSRVKLYFFAGAGLSQAAWNRLEQVTERHCGERIRIMAGLGMTETSPSCLFTTGPRMRAGYVGLPAPGCSVRLVPTGGKLEARFSGPHVMEGYWRADADVATRAFDAQGYYCSGDALRFSDPDDPAAGLMFDGRIAEDFKLSTGTFVSVGPMRAKLVSAGAPYVQDAVVTGSEREAVGVLVFPRIADCRALAGLAANAQMADVLRASAVRRRFADLLDQINRESTGSSTFVSGMVLMDEAPSLDAGEITDKGSLNANAVLSRRTASVSALYDASCDDPLILRAVHSSQGDHG